MTGDLCSTGCPQACPVSFQDTRQARLRLIPLICHAESRALKDRRPQLGDPASACRRGGHPDQPGGPRSRAPAGGRGALLLGSDSTHRRRLRRGRRGRPPPRAVGGWHGTAPPQPAATISSNSRRTQSSSATTRSSQASVLVASAPCATARGTPGPAGATARIRPRSRWSPADHPWSPRSCAAWLARPPGRSTGARRRRNGPPTGPGPGCPPGRAGG